MCIQLASDCDLISLCNRFMLQSTVLRQMVVSRIQTSASQLPKLVEHLSQLQASSRLPSRLSNVGTSPGSRISLHKMLKPHRLSALHPRHTDELPCTSQESMLLLSAITMAQRRLPIGSYAHFRSRSVLRMSFSSLVSS